MNFSDFYQPGKYIAHYGVKGMKWKNHVYVTRNYRLGPTEDKDEYEATKDELEKYKSLTKGKRVRYKNRLLPDKGVRVIDKGDRIYPEKGSKINRGVPSGIKKSDTIADRHRRDEQKLREAAKRREAGRLSEEADKLRDRRDQEERSTKRANVAIQRRSTSSSQSSREQEDKKHAVEEQRRRSSRR